VEARLAAREMEWGKVLTAIDSAREGLDERAHQMRARAYEGVNEPNKAIEAYRKALSIHPHSPGLCLGLGAVQRMVGHVAPAKRSFQTALKYDPQDGRILNNLGAARSAQGDLKQAITLF